jgi:hypothetical protein
MENRATPDVRGCPLRIQEGISGSHPGARQRTMASPRVTAWIASESPRHQLPLVLRVLGAMWQPQTTEGDDRRHAPVYVTRAGGGERGRRPQHFA